MLTAKRLKELLKYNPETGIFTRLVDVNTKFLAGQVAGCLCTTSGYVMLKVDGKQYRAHRLAFLYMYGKWPKGQVDHIEGDKADNRMSKLKVVTSRGNQSNRYTHRNGRLVGTSFHKMTGKWQAKIVFDKKAVYLGLYTTEKEAHEAYIKALNGLNEGDK